MSSQLTIKAPNAKLVRKGLQDLTREIPLIGRQQIYNAMSRAKKILSTPKKRPGYPIQWDSAKQKRAFFHTNGFGRGIPTTRTNKSLQWDLERRENGYSLSNPVDYSRYLYGNFEGRGQSRIFEADYPLFRDVIENELQHLPEEIDKQITYRSRYLMKE